MKIKINNIPEKDLFFCDCGASIHANWLLFWYYIHYFFSLLSFSGIILLYGSFCGIILFLFWYYNLLFWYDNIIQPAEYEALICISTYHNNIKKQENARAGARTYKRKKTRWTGIYLITPYLI